MQFAELSGGDNLNMYYTDSTTISEGNLAFAVQQSAWFEGQELGPQNMAYCTDSSEWSLYILDSAFLITANVFETIQKEVEAAIQL